MKRVTTVEPRDAGKWMSDEPERRNQTDVSGGNASTSRRSPRPVVVGGTHGLDRTHVDAAHVGGVSKPGLVPTVGQDLCARQSAKGLSQGLAERREGRGGEGGR